MAAKTVEEIQVVLSAKADGFTETFDDAGKKVKEFKDASEKTSPSTSKLKEKLAGLSKQAKYLRRQLDKLITVSASWFKESNDFIEAQNLFAVTMGKGADSAREYAEKIQNLMGIDIKEWMNYQGSFNQMITGFGVASEQAEVMSQQLTQLAYDLSSVWNKPVSEAFNKLQSGMSGQIKGLKEFGINVSIAQIKETALAHGIELSTSKMTEAQKSMLRYVTIMEKGAYAQGDMARTLVSPANAMRILEQQITRLKRALGNVVSVIVTKFIPYVQVMVLTLEKAALAIAKFFGFKLPEFDYSGLDSMAGSFDSLDESLEDSNANAKKLKRTLMGFDELNVLQDNTTNTVDNVLGGGLPDDLGLNADDYAYDFTKNIKLPDFEPVKEKLKDILWYVGIIGTALLAWNIGKFIQGLDLAKLSLKGLLDDSQTLIGVVMIIAGLMLTVKGYIDAWKNGLDLKNTLEILGGIGLVVGGLFLAFGEIAGAIGLVVGGIALVVIAIKDMVTNGVNWLNSLVLVIGGVLTGVGIAMIAGTSLIAGGLIGAAVAAVGVLIALFIKNRDKINKWATEQEKKVNEWFDKVNKTIDEWFDKVNKTIDEWVDKVNKTIDEWVDKVNKTIDEWVERVVADIGAGLQAIRDDFKRWKDEFFSSVKEVKEYFSTKVKEVKEYFLTKVKEAKDGLINYGEQAKTFIKNLPGWVKGKFDEIGANVKKSIKDTINGAISLAERGVNNLINRINGFQLGVPDWIQEITGWGGKLKIFNLSPITIPRLASGGFVENQGQMFIAREAGPELVGTIGNRTAVVNNAQIVESVAAGVEDGSYKGLARALREYGGTGDIYVVMDADDVTKKVIRKHNEIVKATGSSPLLVGG